MKLGTKLATRYLLPTYNLDALFTITEKGKFFVVSSAGLKPELYHT